MAKFVKFAKLEKGHSLQAPVVQVEEEKADGIVFVNAMKTIKKLLGWIGFNFCQHCGSNLILFREHGFYEYKEYICPKCDVI
jgi:hypothetical protein